MTSLFFRRAATLALLLSKPLGYTPPRSFSAANDKCGPKTPPRPTNKRAAVKAARKQSTRSKKRG